MNQETLQSLSRLEAVAKNLNEEIERLRNSLPLNETLKPKQWVILKSQYKFYQFLNNTPKNVALIRDKQPEFYVKEDFNKNFRIANPDEVFQHENFLLM